MNIEIESVGVEQLSVWLDWRETVLAEVFAEMPPPEGVELRLRNQEYIQKHLEDDSCVLCFAREGERIVGCGGACLWDAMPAPDNPTGRIAFLMSIFVTPQHRKQSIGRKIVSWLLEQIRSRGISLVLLETSTIGRSVYEALGFTDAKDYMLLRLE